MEETETQTKIVFVCTGNTCRSPMAEALFRSEAKRRKLDAVAYSAGISARSDRENINEKSVFVLLENGLSVENFHSRPLDKKTLSEATHLICMTDAQRDFLMDFRWELLKGEGKELENNVLSFSDLCGYEIADPYGKDVEAYRRTFDLIDRAMPRLFEKLFPEKKRVRAEKKKTKKTSEKKHAPRGKRMKRTSTRRKTIKSDPESGR